MKQLAIPSDYQETLMQIKDTIHLSRYNSLQAVNSEMIRMYLAIGSIVFDKVIYGWGDSVVDKLSADLMIDFPGVKGFSPRNIRRMKLVFEQTNNKPFWTQAVSKIPWGHTNLIFSKLKEDEQIEFYLSQCAEKGWSRSTLEEEIRFDAFSKRVAFQSNFDSTLNEKRRVMHRLEFRDEYDLSFLELDAVHSERDLEQALVSNITRTIGRFGADFAFMGRQFRLELDDKEYFIDILFYHRKLKCMVAVELKTGEFKPEHSQQLNWYLHLLDKTIKYEDDKPSIGILLCKSKSEITVEYALELVNRPMGVSTYTYTQLPSEIAKYLPNESQLTQIFSEDEEKLSELGFAGLKDKKNV